MISSRWPQSFSLSLLFFGLWTQTVHAQQEAITPPSSDKVSASVELDLSDGRDNPASEFSSNLPPNKLPNIVIFLMDDMGVGDCKPYDDFCEISLPSIERLAKNGMIFTDAHSPAAVCAPTRYSILTGNYPWRGRDPTGTWGTQLPSQILPGQKTLADLAKSKNYRTSFFGKEHLGGGYVLKSTGKAVGGWTYDLSDIDWSKPMPEGLQTKGFDWVYSLPAGIQGKPYAFFRDGLIQSEAGEIRHWPVGEYGESIIQAEGFGASDWDSSQAGPLLTDDALAFLEDHYARSENSDEGNPFLLYYSTQSCHSPHSPPATLAGVPIKGASGISDHLDMIIEADVTLGLLMKRIEDAGELENTLFLFTSDNGGLGWSPPLANRTKHRSSGNWRGGKAQIFEGGHRVPLIAMWGDGTMAGSKIPPGTRSDTLVGGQDLFATLAELLDLSPGPKQGLDSFSFLGQLFGVADAPARESMLIQSNVEMDKIYQKKMKIWREGPWKLVVTVDNEPIYFHNLDQDPKETMDLIAHPEHKERIERMHKNYLREIKSKRSVPENAGRMGGDDSKKSDSDSYSLHSELLNPDVSDPYPIPMPVVRVKSAPGLKVQTSMDYGEWRAGVKGILATRRESTMTLMAPYGGWDIYKKLWVVVDIKNQGSEDLLLRFGPLFTQGQLGAEVIPAGESRSVPALIYRNLKPEHAYLAKTLPHQYGQPGGHMNLWRKMDVTSVEELLMSVSSREGKSVDFVMTSLRAVIDFSPPSEEELTKGFVPYMDRFGQARHDDWEGKIQSVADLKTAARLEGDSLIALSRPRDWNMYGGWAAGPQLEATGHFRTHKMGEAWWLVDPLGNLFWSAGITGVSVNTRPSHGGSKTPGLNEILAGIPKDEPQANELPGIVLPGWAPYLANLYRKYGSDWKGVGVERAHLRMAAWGFNTLGNWSSGDVISAGKTPYVQAVHYERPSLRAGRTNFQANFPDIYDPEFTRNLNHRMAGEVGRTTEDPWCIGYFVDNELPFKNIMQIMKNLVEAPASSYTKIALGDYLRETHASVEGLNHAWKTSYADWNSFLESDVIPTSRGYKQDARTFSVIFMNEYYRLCREAVKKVAPHKLYLGSRIHEHFPELYEASAAHTDVVSINHYQYSPVVLSLLQDTPVDKPFLIGEFHFGTINEKGVWGAGLIPAASLEESARLMKNYFQDALADPRIVGAHWFQYRDQVVSGRGDGENYRIGFVDITDNPYDVLTNASREVGETMYSDRFERFQPKTP